MAERFVLTAEIQLRAPTNTAQVRDEVQRQLNGVTIPVTVKGAPQSARALSQVEKKVDSLTTASERMGNSFGLSLKRFAAFSIANRAVGLFTSKTAAAINEAIDFETELIKVVQVTGKTKKELTGLTDTITKLSTALVGTSSKGLLSTARILSQAGIAAGELDVALTALAKTTLAPTFDDIEQTAEGAVAVLAQFGEGVGALERQLGAVNAVAGQFAVESGDLISAVRRTGGVFKSAGGDLNELLALFTSVRATTRESAESIATGLRTIFTRIQRPQTIEYMKQFGVELTDLEGRFVGPFEAVRQLSGALSSFEEGDIRFVKIAEELGGFRQIGKVLPLIQKFEIAEKARQAALDGGNSLTEDTIVAQQGLAVQFTKVREEFLALARSMTETGAFRTMVQTLLSLSSSLISLSESFKPIMPILVGLAGIKIARGLGGFAAGLGSGLARKSEGGPVLKFAHGGLVPGRGHGDTFPAMLEEGEFVVKRDTVDKVGAENLARLNNGGSVQRYAGGSIVIPDGIDPLMPSQNKGGLTGGLTLKQSVDKFNIVGNKMNMAALTSGFGKDVTGRLIKPSNAALQTSKQKEKARKDKAKGVISYTTQDGAIGGFFLNPVKGDDARRKTTKDKKFKITGGKFAGHPGKLLAGSTIQGFSPSVKDMKATPSLSASVEESVSDSMEKAMLSLVPAFDKHVSVGKFDGKEAALSAAAKKIGKDPNVVSTTTGFMFEGIIQALTGAKFAGDKSNFDFDEKSLGVDKSRLSQLFGSSKVFDLVKADAKKNANAGGLIFNKIANDLKQGNESGVTRLAGGGPSDTVDALLTPGEWVVPKDVAERVGYGNLDRMNKSGVKGFAKGGIVGPQKFASGSGPKGVQPASDGNGGGGKALAGLFALQAVPSIIQNMVKSEGEHTTATERVVNSMTNMVSKIAAVAFALQAFGISLNKESAKRALSLGGFGKGGLGNTIKTQFSKRGASLDKVKRFESVNESRVARGAKPFDLSEKLSGRTRFEAGLTRASGKVKGGFSGADRLLGKPIGKLAGLFGRLGGGLLKFSGPIGIAATVAGGFSSVLSAYQDNLGRYNDAVKEGNVAKAQELAVSKNVSGLANLVGEAGIAAEQWVREAFGGNTAGQLQALAKSSALAAKHQNEFADNAKRASIVLDDIQSGRISASEAFSEGDLTKNFTSSKNTSEALKASAVEDRKNKPSSDEIGFWNGLGDGVRNIVSITTLVDSVAAKNRSLETSATDKEKQAKELNDKEFDALAPAFKALGREAVSAGNTGKDGFKLSDNADIAALGLTADQISEVNRAFNNQSDAIQENIDYMKALDFGLRGIIATSKATAVSMEGLLKSTQVGSNPFEQSIANIQSAMSNVASEMSVDTLLDTRDSIASSLTDSGASDKQVESTIGTFDLISNVAKNSAGAFKKLQQDKRGGGVGAQTLLKDLGKNLSVGQSPEQAKRIQDITNKLDLSNAKIASAIDAGSFGEVADAIQKELVGAFGKDLIQIQEARKRQEAVLINLTTQKIALQTKEIDAIQKSVAIRLDSLNTIAEFTGNRASGDKKKTLLAEGVNSSLKAAGVGQANAGTGAAGIAAIFRELNVANLQTTNKQGRSIVQDGVGAFQGAEGLDANKLDEINRANSDLLQFTKDRIGIVREELALARKKTDLERSAVEKLLDGDFLGFIEGEQTAKAADALRSGDSGAASQFSPKALATAFRSLRDEGLESGKLQKAAEIALGPFADARKVNLLTGNTKEEQPFIKEGVALSKAMVEAGRNLVDFADRDINVNNATIRVAQRQKAAAGFANGGTVYANQGMFVPRGTDTVPAMLTPGEFVVNRRSVQRGNNLQLLQAMNGGDGVSYGRGGVSYRKHGGRHRRGGSETGSNASSPSVSIDTSELITSLNNSFTTFQASVDQLSKIKVKIAFDTTNVNVTLTESSFVASMKKDVKNEILELVVKKVRTMKHATNGTHKIA
jgi:hypothetical protein